MVSWHCAFQWLCCGVVSLSLIGCPDSIVLAAENNISSAHEADLSIIIPNYNHGSTVAEAVRAAVGQKPTPREVIVVDDGSTDDSRAILAHLQHSEPRLRVLNLERNGGAIAAMNRGLAEAKGTFVNFGAADDVTLPGLVAAAMPLLENAPGIAFASGEAVVVDIATGARAMRPPVLPVYDAQTLTPQQVAEVFARMENWILPGTAIIRRKMLSEIGGFDATLGSFADGFAVRKLAFSHGCAFFCHCGVEWRVVQSGLSRSLALSTKDSENLLRQVIARMRADPAFPADYPARFERRWRFSTERIRAANRPFPLRLFLYVFLTLKYRPMTLAGLLRTLVHRAMSS